jgi:hypothetical protein
MSKSLVKRGDPMRDVVAVSQNQLMQTVTNFGKYVDDTGAKATSERGLVMSINGAIKKYYGLPRNEMGKEMLLHVSSALVRIIGIVESGMETRRTRDDIKTDIRAILKDSGESYHAIGRPHANAA